MVVVCGGWVKTYYLGRAEGGGTTVVVRRMQGKLFAWRGKFFMECLSARLKQLQRRKNTD